MSRKLSRYKELLRDCGAHLANANTKQVITPQTWDTIRKQGAQQTTPFANEEASLRRR